MRIEQFVMAYGVEQDRLRAILPQGFISLRPVLRINGEVRDDATGYLEFNTAVQKGEVRGWLNIGHWENVPMERTGETVTFRPDFLTISFTETGIEGGCPAEKDNAGCFFLLEREQLRPPEVISANKTFCDCEFAWHFCHTDARGRSIGKTLPAIPTAPKTVYPKLTLLATHAAAIPCQQVLGAYVVRFVR